MLYKCYDCYTGSRKGQSMKSKNAEVIFRLKGLKELETSRGISWSAKVTRNGVVVGDVYDDGASIVPDLYISKEYRAEFAEWSKLNADADWLAVDVDAEGVYALSDLYAKEVEGVKI